jgi:hypothetical protein
MRMMSVDGMLQASITAHLAAAQQAEADQL